MKNAGINAAIVVLYIVFSVVLTYPIVFHMDDMVPGFYDVWNHLWNLWWVRTSMLELHENPYYTHYLFHPSGADLALHELALVDGMMALPFKNPVFAYNILCLLSFALAGLGMYLLTFYLTGDRKAAFISGLVYAFAPYHFFEVSVGHLNLLTIQWIPFYVLYLMKTVGENGRRNPFYCAFFLLLVSLSTWQYALYATVFTLLYLLHVYMNDKGRLTAGWPRIKVLALCCLAFIGPFLVNAFVSAASREYIMRRSFFTVTYYSSEALGIFLPNLLHPLYGRYVQDVFKTVVGGSVYPAAVSLGWTTLLLIACYVAKRESLFGWVKGKLASVKYTKRVKAFVVFVLILNAAFLYLTFRLDLAAWIVWSFIMVSVVVLYYLVREGKVGFWLLSALAFWMLSMGPVLQFMGRMYFPLPYLFLMVIPMIRAPYRAVVFLNLSAAVLAGMGFSELDRRFNRGVPLVLLVSSLLLLEFLSVPVPLVNASVSSFYYSLRNESGDFAVLDVQVAPLVVFYSKGNSTVYVSHDMPEYMYYQTIHGKRMVGGLVSCMYGDLADFLDNTPVLHQLRYPGSRDILKQNVSEIANGILSYYNIRYVIVHNDTIHLLDDVQENASVVLKQTINRFFHDNDVVYNDSGIYVIKVREEPVKRFMRLGRGWYLPSNGSRWMKDYAELVIVSRSEVDADVCFEAKGAVKAPLEANGRVFRLNESFSVNTLRVHLNQGGNVVVFKSIDGCLEKPCVSFNFRRISTGACSVLEDGRDV